MQICSNLIIILEKKLLANKCNYPRKKVFLIEIHVSFYQSEGPEHFKDVRKVFT